MLRRRIAQPPLTTSSSEGRRGRRCVEIAGRAAARRCARRAQLGGAGARIGGDLGFVRRDRPLGQHAEGRRRRDDFGQMARAGAGAAALGKERLDDAVFQRMERHHDQPARQACSMRSAAASAVDQLVQLVVDEDAQRLERPGRRMNLVRLARGPRARRCRPAPGWWRSAPPRARPRWRGRRRANAAPRRAGR